MSIAIAQRLLPVLGALFLSATVSAVEKPRVLSISPQGSVTNFKQVTARFATDMTKSGLQTPAPFAMQCVAGSGKWTNSRTWIWTPSAAVPNGKVCQLAMVAGLKDALGSPLTPVKPVSITQSLAAAAQTHSVSGKARLELFTPQGEARGVKQVVARFSEPMIRLGEPKVYNPFGINCSAKGTGRWLDTRNWVYDFEQPLASGVACSFVVVNNLRSVAGNAVAANPVYQFHTGAPTVLDEMPYRGSEGIDENQVFLLKFDSKLDRASLPKATYCLIEGIKERVPVKFLTLEETNAIFQAGSEDLRDWWKNETAYSAEGEVGVAERRALKCSRTLPANAQVKLILSADLQSVDGVKSRESVELNYNVRPQFKAEFSCTRENARQACSPLGRAHIAFSGYVPGHLLKAMRIEGGGKTWLPEPTNESGGFDSARYVEFKGPFPPNTSFLLKLPSIFTDDTGRALINGAQFPMPIKTAAYPPLAKFSASFGVIEKAVGAVPLTVRQLEPGLGNSSAATLSSYQLPDNDRELVRWLERFNKHQQKHDCVNCMERDENNNPKEPDPRSISLLKNQSGVHKQPLPKQLGAQDFEVLGLPVANTGVYIHEVESQFLGHALIYNQAPMYVAAMSVVTNLGVHLRAGKEASQVWVTTLDTAKPVANADVAVWDCQGRAQVWSGKTNSSGLAHIDRALSFDEWGECMNSRYIIIARFDNDRALVLPHWQEGIEPWRFNFAWSDKKTGDKVAHTILDRTLFRAGETVHMRHLIRDVGLKQLGSPKALDIHKVVIKHIGSDQEYELEKNIDLKGNGENTWVIPKAAKLGNYAVEIRTKENYLESAQFRVADFRLPVLRAKLQLPTQTIANKATIPVDMQLAYLNGGAYGKVPVQLRGRLMPAYLEYPDYPEFNFDVWAAEKDIDLTLTQHTLDDNGGLRIEQRLPKVNKAHQLMMEMEFRDPSGETQTVASRTQVWPAEVVPGIYIPDWAGISSGKTIPIKVITLGTDGKPKANVPVKIEASLTTQQTHRKRTIGGFYAYETINQTREVPIKCEGKSDASGLYTCQARVTAAGEVKFTAIAQDAHGNTMRSETDVWVWAADRWWFSQANNDRIDLVPEKKAYEAGETMRFQVRMPFEQATALISVERDGIIESFVQTLSSTNATITLPVKAEYAPNVYVSAFLVRGREAGVAPTAFIDLGKPAFKLGIANVKVGWDAFRLGVDVKTEKNRYQPRENVAVSVHVSPPKGQALPANTEVTLAVVDEALLELSENNSWDVLTPMMAPRGFGVDTATSQLQVVGKRHFGRKALPAGGGGGRGLNTRELFDTLAFWQGRAVVDANGRAQFTVPLNDSLTRFKVVAVASSENRFGSGDASIVSTQDLQIISGLPQMIRYGDKLSPRFTLRNSSAEPQDINFKAEIEGLGVLLSKSLRLKSGEAANIDVPLITPANVAELKWVVSAVSKTARDDARFTQRVLDAIPERVLQATLVQLDKPLQIPVQKPANALAGGGLVVSAQASLASSLGSVNEWFKQYPYTCLEQQTAVAVGTHNKAAWDRMVENLPTYMDESGLVGFYPNTRGYPFLTAHVLNMSHLTGWTLPSSLRDQMLNALINYVEGKNTFEDWRFSANDDVQRKLEVLAVLAKYKKFQNKYLDTIKIDAPRFSARMLVDWLELLKQSALPNKTALQAQAETLLRSKLSAQGTVLLLSGGQYSHWWLYDNTTVTMAKLILAVNDLTAWQADMPKLVRGLANYQKQGRWDTTLANLWGSLALKRFSQRFEQEPVTGRTLIDLALQSEQLDWEGGAPHAIRLAWPDTKAQITLEQNGTGKPWVSVQSRARVPVTKAESEGFSITKTLSPIQQKVTGVWSAGDVARVRLTMKSSSDIGWVVIDDPVPAGATLLGRALARDSTLLTANESGKGIAPTYAEFAVDAYRAYYERIYRGDWSVEYTVRFNQAGSFKLPPTKVEAMYAPEMFGLAPNQDMIIKP